MAGKDFQDHQVMMEDGPTHSSLLLETAGGAVLPLLSLTWSLNLDPRVNQSLDEAGVLHSSLAESPRAMERCVNVVYYLCNLLLIYTGGEPAQQSRIKLSTECFQFVSPRSPHKSRVVARLPICLGWNGSGGKSTLQKLPNPSKETRLGCIIIIILILITQLSVQHPRRRRGQTSPSLAWVATRANES